MAKIIRKSIFWFLVSVILIFGLNFYFKNLDVKADSAATSVTVGNSAPTLGTPAESPASSGTSPTNVGSNVTFQSTSTDPNTDNWYLAICKTNVINPGTGGGAPTCDTASTWCISTSTVSGAQASCAYETAGATESNAWFAFACDAASSSQTCSASQQGSGDSGSPFKVNHRPLFTVYEDDSAVNPAATVTWTTTASDSDTDTAADTVSLYVCKADDFTGTACGIGGMWCSATAAASNPTCNTPAPRPDGNWAAYGFVIDSHNFAASGVPHGTDSVLTVNNVAPSISASTIQLLDTDLSGNLTLTAEQTETTGVLKQPLQW